MNEPNGVGGGVRAMAMTHKHANDVHLRHPDRLSNTLNPVNDTYQWMHL